MKLSAKPRKFRAALSRNGEGTPNDSSDHFYARVAELAYFLYEQRGRQDGHDVEDWIQAEQTVLAAHNQAATKTEERSQRVVNGKRAASEKLQRG